MKARLLTVICENPGLSTWQLAERVGHRERDIRRTLMALVFDDAVYRYHGGWYATPAPVLA